MAAIDAVITDTLPKTILVPMFASTANPVDVRNRKGSSHDPDMLSKTTRRMARADLYRFFGHEVKRFLNLNLVISYLPKKECSDDEFTNEVHRRIP
ncbi:hypothetical protein, partial [Paraeggerthella hongkongensis]|uniref:hypothetical protein n=1 Tax=Paraeggerthella hongkongensis TaxID=230658 RepID=UPI001FCEEAED